MATSLKLDDETKERVRHIAKLHERSPHWIMKRAVEEFLDREEKREAFRHEAREALYQYRKDGKHMTLNETLELVGNMEIEDIRRIKEAEAQRVNRLIEEGGEPLQREYESGLRMWSKLREMALEETRRKAQNDSAKS